MSSLQRSCKSEGYGSMMPCTDSQEMRAAGEDYMLETCCLWKGAGCLTAHEETFHYFLVLFHMFRCFLFSSLASH